MADGGFVAGWVSKIQAAATKGQLGKPYQTDLQTTVGLMLGQAKGWVDGSEEKLVNGVIGKLKLEANLCEQKDPLLPKKHTDPSILVRGRILREAIDLIRGGQ